ncbi:SAM-dependent methyltransferase [Mycobacterium intracellulare]
MNRAPIRWSSDPADRGVRQTVVLAAGLDCRAYRFAWPANSTVFEVDQPQVLHFKQQVLDQKAATPLAKRIVVAMDLRDDWTGALRTAGFDPAQPTACTLEGLLAYLPGPAQDARFDRLHDLSAAGSQIAAELGPEPGEAQQFVRQRCPAPSWRTVVCRFALKHQRLATWGYLPTVAAVIGRPVDNVPQNSATARSRRDTANSPHMTRGS